MKPGSVFVTSFTLWAAPCAGTVMQVRSSATTCPVGSPTYAAPTVSSGWTGQLVISGLTKPRSIVLDSSGALLVLESGAGIRRLTFIDDGGSCLVAKTSTLVVNMTSLNHGLAISPDGGTIYASNADSVFSWPYSNNTGSVTANATTIVSGMGSSGDQTTRTVLASQLVPDTIIVSRGSSGSTDQARNVSSGLGQVKAFNLANLPSNSEALDFSTTGQLLGWGLNDAVGLAEHPKTGGIFSMDNGQDNLTRNGVDVRQSNPGDEMNYHGTISSTEDEDRGGNYGYPFCNAVWNTSIPDAPAGLVTGQQISVFENSTSNDTSCEQSFVRPRLTFQPHQAPLDMLFSTDGETAYVTFHGSSDESGSVGYSVGSVAFDTRTGQPTRAYDSLIALDDIIRNNDDSSCPSSCMRPAGLATLPDGRLLFSSDTTGEIYILVKSSTSSSGYDKTLRVAIGVSVALALVIFILCVCIYLRWRRSRQLLGVHTSGDRGPASLNLGAVHAPGNQGDGGIQLTSGKSSGRSQSERNLFHDKLQRQRDELEPR